MTLSLLYIETAFSGKVEQQLVEEHIAEVNVEVNAMIDPFLQTCLLKTLQMI